MHIIFTIKLHANKLMKADVVDDGLRHIIRD